MLDEQPATVARQVRKFEQPALSIAEALIIQILLQQQKQACLLLYTVGVSTTTQLMLQNSADEYNHCSGQVNKQQC